MRLCTPNGVIRNVHQYSNRGREKLVLVRRARKNRDSFRNQRLAAGSGSPPGAEGLYSSVTPERTAILSGIRGQRPAVVLRRVQKACTRPSRPKEPRFFPESAANGRQWLSAGCGRLVLVRHARKNRDSFRNQRLTAGSGFPAGCRRLVRVHRARKNRDSFRNQRLTDGSGSQPGAEGLYSSVAPGRLKIISACPDRNTGEQEDI